MYWCNSLREMIQSWFANDSNNSLLGCLDLEGYVCGEIPGEAGVVVAGGSGVVRSMVSGSFSGTSSSSSSLSLPCKASVLSKSTSMSNWLSGNSGAELFP